MFVLLRREPRPVETQHGCDGRIGKPAQAGQSPAEQVGRKPQGRQGVADVVVAVAEGSFAVFPGFPPENTGQPDPEAVTACLRPEVLPQLGWDLSPLFQGVMQGTVVKHAACEFLRRRQDQVSLGRVQVSARGVHPQRPAGSGDGLPGRKPHGQFQKPCYRGGRERFRRAGRLIEAEVVRRGVFGEQRQGNDRRPFVEPERVGLVVPVHVPQRPGVAVRVVLGLLVVVEDAFCRRVRHSNSQTC